MVEYEIHRCSKKHSIVARIHLDWILSKYHYPINVQHFHVIGGMIQVFPHLSPEAFLFPHHHLLVESFRLSR